MISHVTVGTADFAGALRFYAPLMERLGYPLRFLDHARPWAVWAPPDEGRPFFILMAPEDGGRADPGNGGMVALLAVDRATVADAYALALSLGGTDGGAPGPRPAYHPGFYGAYVRDPDGNKLCFCNHDEPGGRA